MRYLGDLERGGLWPYFPLPPKIEEDNFAGCRYITEKDVLAEAYYLEKIVFRSQFLRNTSEHEECAFRVSPSDEPPLSNGF